MYLKRLFVMTAAVLIIAFVLIFNDYTPHFSENNSTLIGLELATSGRDNIPPCATCHGLNGEGNPQLISPRLAGLNREYIIKQLKDFSRQRLTIGVNIEAISRDYKKTPRFYKDLTIYTPGIREHEVMSSIARKLSTTDIQEVSEYYSNLSFTAKPTPADFQTLERGADIAIRGKPEYQLPRCSACHGPNGEGFGAHFPPLSGQPREYIIKQINNWQRGSRDNDYHSIMKNVANLLTDADKENVATYYSNLSLTVVD